MLCGSTRDSVLLLHKFVPVKSIASHRDSRPPSSLDRTDNADVKPGAPLTPPLRKRSERAESTRDRQRRDIPQDQRHVIIIFAAFSRNVPKMLSRIAVAVAVAALAAAHSAAASPAGVEKVAGDLVAALTSGDAAAARALLADEVDALVALPDELPFSGAFSGADELAAAGASWYGEALAVEEHKVLRVRADPHRRTAVVTAQLQGSFVRSDRDVAARETWYVRTNAAGSRVVWLRVAVGDPKALVAAHRTRSERLFAEFYEAFHSGGPSAAVKAKVADGALITTSNGAAGMWPVNRKGPKGFERYFDNLARHLQWRPKSMRFLFGDAADCVVEMPMEVNTFQGKREEPLHTIVHASFDDDGLLTLFRITIVDSVGVFELAAPEMPMGMPSDGGAGGADAVFNMAGGMPGGPGGAMPPGYPGGHGGGNADVHVDL